MFGSVGWGEILVLLLVALFVFGPDRLPSVVKDAGGMLRKVRDTLTGTRRQIRDELGDDFPDLDPRMLNPRQFVRRHLLEDLDGAGEFDEPPLGRRPNARTGARNRPAADPKPVTSSGAGSAGTPGAGASAAPASTRTSPSEPAPSTPARSSQADATPGGQATPPVPSAPYDPDTT